MATFWINTDKKTHKYSPHIQWIEAGYAFTGGDIHYGQYFLPVQLGDTLLMYANEIGIVAVGEALETWDGLSHQPQIIYQHDNEYRLRTNWFLDLKSCPFSLEKIKSSLGYIPSKAFVPVESEALQLALLEHYRINRLDPGSSLPDELPSNESYPEGAYKQIPVNAYERNPKARAKCIGYHGAKCKVCDLEFRNLYGRIGLNFIHVHHIRPIAECRGEYQVNPYTDLIPVCPNCHAMLHQRRPPYTVTELKNQMPRQDA
jgi:5-methylcytosine-specific restriction protein A